ncbi:abnormal spindle-like microcephaly-associated protein isoform X2 [Phyllostomus hastatus]|uniref:abnormal spindle-like microcephaly-associated protein isoform X2 n=1 Tax=Phyllostomus hastatus TaxID=9423 RepID=UPI001E6847B7|nr:abnormal spindle-like microcephaly-associated protein isoform X2 [Phyllostomus hastatus]
MTTRRGCRDASPPERKSPAGLRGSPPVLTLSHFCPKPFLCFGDVRLGASKTLPLALLNPNAEAAAVTLPRCPAAAQGFGVRPRALELQPKEKNVISVTWTPVKEGRVREILTFHVNGIVKHEVVLLGNAEEPKKKKRSLWDTINKKKVSAPSNRKRRISNIQNVNQTFSVSQKVDRVRSPLQACENLGRTEGCSPAENSSLVLEESKIPISPISPTFKGHRGEPCLPLCVRRSTTYTSLHAPENGGLWKLEEANISKDFNEKVLTETSFSSVNSNGQVEEGSPLSLTPNCPPTLNVTQSHGSFLSPDSFLKNSHAAGHELHLVPCVSPGTFLKDNARPVHLESKTGQEVYRTILSPDSFLKDNYGLSQGVGSEPVTLVLSPSRFVKEDITHRSLSQPMCQLSPLLNGNSQASASPQVQKKNEVLLYIPECQGSNSPETIFEEPKSSEMNPNCDSLTKRNQPQLSAVQGISGHSHNTQLKRRPILSATVTKLKPTGTRENKTQTRQPKARRCLRSVEGGGEKVTDNVKEEDAFHSYLPVIDSVVSGSASCKKGIDPSSKAASAARKRRSEGNQEEACVPVRAADDAEALATQRIPFSPWEPTTSAAKKTRRVITPVCKQSSGREKLHPRKRTDSLAHKTPNSKTNRRTKRVVPVAQTTLTLIKPLKTGIPRHPMPFAARNMFYDERWKEKQQQGFTWWLNFVLTPDDLTVKTSVSEVNAAALLLGAESQHKLSVPRAPTKDEMSLRAYTARCRLNRLRRAACRLFTSEPMVRAIRKLEVEIEARRLAVRRDRHLWKDVGERQKVLSWLLSYNPLWLRIGLETVFGELIALEDNSDVTGMAVFVLGRLLWNPDIAAEYRHPSVPHLYRDGHEEALSQFTLKKLLLLVCFLDYAKVSRLIDHDPCLFCKDAEFKASKDLLLAFSRDFLSGEGDLSRHLGWLGLPVSHVQTPFDEFDFAVTNLAVDLQCGVRLVRAVELLTQNWDLSKRLRVPAISRLQKLHNVELALQALRARGVQLQDEHGSAILAKDIVDRHREKTLALLWKIALAFQVDISLNLHQLREEIDFLRHTWRLKKTASTLSSRQDAGRGARADPRPGGPSAPQSGSESVGLLLEWADAVCAFYRKNVENFTVSFSDGRVLCYLVHHYHPGYLPFDAICQRTTQTVECAQTGSVVLNSSSESEESCLDALLEAPDPRAEGAAEVHRELLENEKKNFRLVGAAVRDLGGVPAMLRHEDMSNTIPDEKVVITFLSFLCARLLDLRRETRAARLIQTAWREHKLRSDRRRHQERDRAARIIQSAAAHFLAKRWLQKAAGAARVIQKHWRRVLRQRELLMLKKAELEKIRNESALAIQKHWRRYSTRKKFLKLKHYSIILQSRIRTKMAVASYKRCVWAAVTIQRRWRACVRGRRDRQRYRTLRASCLVIQAAFRRWRHRRTRLRTEAAVRLQRAFRRWRAGKRAEEEKSATLIQSWFRMHRERRRYSRTRSCVLTIQAAFRRFQAQRVYQRQREAVRTIQTRWRAHLQAKVARTQYLRKLAAAVRIQAAFRAARARRLRRRDGAARVLQSHWRTRQERLRFLALRRTAVTLQAHVRKHQQSQRYRKVRQAALVIQTRFRAHIAARTAQASYQRTRSATIVLQAACRAWRARKTVRHALTCVVRIQSCYRGHVCRRRFLSLRHATVKFQSIVRMRQARARFLQLRAAAVFVQRRYRFLQAAARRREELRRVLQACVRLQAWARGHLVRRQARLQRAAATSLQAHFRMRTARRSFLRMRRAALVVQRCFRAHRARLRLRQREALRAQSAATCLQAAFRGHRVRRLLRRRALAALTIQSALRGHRERANYRRVLQSAVRIQRWYRASRAARALRTQFLERRAAALTLQAAYRGWRVREQVRRERRAAVAVQAAFRRARAQRRFQQLKAAALALQRRRRAQAAGRAPRRDYLRLRQAALALQAAWRGRAARRQVRRQHQCAVLIQSCYRMHAQRRRWVATRKAARLIQTWYRACCWARRQRLSYLKTRAAVLVLQSAYRRLRERRRRAEERSGAASTIQAGYRAYRARRRRAAAVAIQRWYRSARVAHRQREAYLRLRKAATRIQAVYRGRRVRRHVRRMHAAATFIKATFQTHLLTTRYCKMRAAAVVIQVRYRAYRRGRAQRAQYLAVLQAVGILQASFRGARVRWRLRKMQAAAVVVQSHYRRHREQARFRKVKAATEAVQRRFRALKAGKEQLRRYRRLRRAAVLLQAVFRGARARRRVKAMHAAAALFQRRFRALRARRRFLSLRRAALCVQRRYRARVLARHHLAFLRLQQAVITIQSAVRGWAVRKRLREMSRAATVIQATFRMHRAQASYQALRHAAVLVQRRYRACRAAKLQRERFVRQRRSAVAVQAAYRGLRARRLLQEAHRAAVLEQGTCGTHGQPVFCHEGQWATQAMQEKHGATRGKALAPSAPAEAGARVQVGSPDLAVGKQGQEQQLAATAVEKHFRDFRGRKRHLRLRAAVACVHRKHRAIAAARTLAALRLPASHGDAREQGGTSGRPPAAPPVQPACSTHGAHAARSAQGGAAAAVQSPCRPRARGTAGRRGSSAVQTSAPAARAALRSILARLELEDTAEEDLAATADRPASRCGLAETGQEAARSSAGGPPVCSEALVAGSRPAAGRSRGRAAVAVPTALHTMATGTRDWELWAARRIQPFLRAAACRRRFVRQRRAAVTLQLSFRARRARRQLSRWRRAAAVCPTCLRACPSAGRQGRACVRAGSSAVTVQARTRGRLQTRRSQKVKASALNMQIPGERASVRLLRFAAAAHHHLSALRIQRAYRRHLAVEKARRRLRAAIRIQRWFRTRLQLRRQMRKCHSVANVNREAEDRQRRHRAASLIQRAVRRFLRRRELERVRNGVVQMQALWRGYSWRKKNDCAKIRAVRRSLQAVNAEAREENRLSRRAALALHGLLTYRHLSAVLEALKHLEAVTRLSPLCCESVAGSGGVAKVLALIRSCNRSVPCMDVVSYAVQVLLNVAKYEKTMPAVYRAEACVDTLLELLQVYREKPGDKVADKSRSIFSRTCCLLVVLLQATGRASDVWDRPRVVDCVHSIYRLTARKHGVNRERTPCGHNKNASRSTPGAPVRSRAVPRLQPDWVLGRDNGMAEITAPLQAIQMVMDTLGVPC